MKGKKRVKFLRAVFLPNLQLASAGLRENSEAIHCSSKKTFGTTRVSIFLGDFYSCHCVITHIYKIYLVMKAVDSNSNYILPVNLSK